ncbi:hypothetical protein [Cytobacillus firmus]|uniref:hypothetical protein n=1 Tax=Cytobacillus firmus TaxID=1399 RepID=UPI001C8D27A9|nr:hypothetical protein [Cytobacillus firmus]MBX9972540.1 hypothetical protein [Cytobacillus firmus]
MQEQLKKINAVAPDTNANIEGLSNLMQTSFDEAQLSQVIDNLAGAAIRFSETLKFEGLSDGLQETLAAGEAVGPFAELLERSGIVLDDFNKGLASAIKNGEEGNYILQALADTGLASVYEEFKNNNKELIANREATLRFQTAMAELGATLLPIVAAASEKIAELTEWFNGLDESQQKTILTIGGIFAAVGPLIVIIGTIITAIGGLITIAGALGIGLGALMGIIAAVVAAIGLLIAAGVYLYQNWEEISTKGQEIFTNVLNFLINTFNLITNVVNQAMDWIDQKTGGSFTSITNTVRNFMSTASNILERGWRFIKDTFSNALKFAKALLTGDFETMWQVVDDQMGNIEDTVKDIWGEVEDFFEGIDLSEIGADIIRGLISGIASMAGAIMRKVG